MFVQNDENILLYYKPLISFLKQLSLLSLQRKLTIFAINIFDMKNTACIAWIINYSN